MTYSGRRKKQKEITKLIKEINNSFDNIFSVHQQTFDWYPMYDGTNNGEYVCKLAVFNTITGKNYTVSFNTYNQHCLKMFFYQCRK